MTTGENKLSSLMLSVVHWCERLGVSKLNELPGLWERETPPLAPFGALTVRVNAHDFPVDNVPPFTAAIHPTGNPLGFVCMVDPYGGSIMAGGWGWGEHEIEVAFIAHFDGLEST